MTLIVNIVLALSLLGAIGFFFLFRQATADAVSSSQGANLTAQERIAAKMTVDGHRLWEVFSVLLMVIIIAGFFFIN